MARTLNSGDSQIGYVAKYGIDNAEMFGCLCPDDIGPVELVFAAALLAKYAAVVILGYYLLFCHPAGIVVALMAVSVVFGLGLNHVDGVFAVGKLQEEGKPSRRRSSMLDFVADAVGGGEDWKSDWIAWRCKSSSNWRMSKGWEKVLLGSRLSTYISL